MKECDVLAFTWSWFVNPESWHLSSNMKPFFKWLVISVAADYHVAVLAYG